MKNEFTLTIYSEDQLRLINKLSAMFLRKQVQIVSLNMSVCEMDKIYRHTIVVNETLDVVVNLAAQIEKVIEVFRCFYHLNEELVCRQVALFKIPTAVFLTGSLDFLLRKNDLKISEIQQEYVILQATATADELEALTEKLNPLGLIEFVRSSGIAMVKSGGGFVAEI
ncbi:acetolactate synthase small subunit [Flavobacterium branchiicola]|uniref:Acetolactate synthase small subunit n=1 Tax=Flavobacterium branchiicola TaxID=1114875 RepID=A0ABV9PB60_9FLAO|nr:acetolactate synthase small subunit [Flavobacterium branchiicola]MBS7254009.1 acetolactate synthase small subunit [Flavobacterium branchiicola]